MLRTMELEKILSSAGFAHCVYRPTDTGLYNNSYYLKSGDDEFVLRVAPGDNVAKLFYEKGMMAAEPAIHRIVKEQTNLPVPKIVYSDFSRSAVDRDFLIVELLPGSPGDFDRRELGRYIKQLHAIEADYYGYPEREVPTGKSWPKVFRLYVELIFNDCLTCGMIDKREYDEFLAVYERNFDAVKDAPAALLHLDLWTQNILTEQRRITGIIDFDRGLYGDPELEFAALDTYGYSGPEFFAGYGSARPWDEEAQVRQKLYIVYELIKYVFIRAQRDGSEHFGREHVRQCQEILCDI